MLLRVPVFYDSFHCIADKCTDTCCVGWEIDIDENSLKRYATIKGDFGNSLRQNIEDGHFKLREGDRCPFLKQDGLCDMICHLGESSLCDICREHPRFVEVYGDIMEKGLGLCCEADHARPLNERLIELLDFAVETSGIEYCDFNGDRHSKTDLGDNSDNISNNILQSWIDSLGKGESFGPAWDQAYKELSLIANAPRTKRASSLGLNVGLFTESDGEKIITYLLFRYYAKSLFDGNSLTKVQFALYFWIMLQKFGDIFAKTAETPNASDSANAPTAKIAAIKLLSKQTEYSEEIMNILEQEFTENPLFSPENFKKVLKR